MIGDQQGAYTRLNVQWEGVADDDDVDGSGSSSARIAGLFQGGLGRWRKVYPLKLNVNLTP